jgi:hypothetical protein
MHIDIIKENRCQCLHGLKMGVEGESKVKPRHDFGRYASYQLVNGEAPYEVSYLPERSEGRIVYTTHTMPSIISLHTQQVNVLRVGI